jgi:AcrR family transcriptional regulator
LRVSLKTMSAAVDSARLMSELPAYSWPAGTFAEDVSLLPGSMAAPLRTGVRSPAADRAALLDGLVRVLAERGLHECSPAAVAAAAGVSEQDFYRCFTDVEECLLEVYEQGTQTLLYLISAACREAPSWPEGVRCALRVLLEILAEEELFAWALVVEIAAAGPRAHAAVRGFHERFKAVVTELGGSAKVPDVVADATVAGIHGVLYEYVTTGRTPDLPELLPALTYFAVLPWLGREEAAAQLA